jgi:hypothetical protein
MWIKGLITTPIKAALLLLALSPPYVVTISPSAIEDTPIEAPNECTSLP